MKTSTIFRGTSNRIQNDLIIAISDLVLNKIKEEIKTSPFVALLLDETSDIMNFSQLSTTLRYVDSDTGAIHERFVHFSDVSKDRSAHQIDK